MRGAREQKLEEKKKSVLHRINKHAGNKLDCELDTLVRREKVKQGAASSRAPRPSGTAGPPSYHHNHGGGGYSGRTRNHYHLPRGGSHHFSGRAPDRERNIDKRYIFLPERSSRENSPTSRGRRDRERSKSPEKEQSKS